VDIPSYSVKVADLIKIKQDDSVVKKVREVTELVKDRGVPAWLQSDPKQLEGKIVRLPQREDIPFPVHEQLIVELYSK
jgi:small subunit ribosomal protein S4